MIHIFKILFIGLLGFTSLHAKMIFDLQEQYFEHAYNQSSKSGLYKLPNVSVSTINILQQKDGKYVTDFASSGMLIVRLNEIKENFSMSMKARYKSTYFMRSTSIMLKSDDGEEFIIMFNKDEVVVQEKKIPYQGLNEEILNIAIKKAGDTFGVFINGQLISQYNMPTFIALKRVEQSINNISGVSSQDSIYDMVISDK